jgi:hypothetical protein
MKDLNKYKTVTEAIVRIYLKAEEAGKILKLSERQIYRIKNRVERAWGKFLLTYTKKYI